MAHSKEKINMFIIRIKSLLANSILNLKRKDNSIFWASQLAVIASTIFGVYLASSEGLKSAVEFHAVTQLEEKYYALNSLREEVVKNNQLVVDFCDKSLVRNAEGDVTAYRASALLNINWFVWQLLQNTDRSLALPTDILLGVEDYVTQTNNLIEEYKIGQRRLQHGIDLYELATETDEYLIKRMDDEIRKYEKTLSSYQIF